jgi:uncharacterized protein YdaL
MTRIIQCRRWIVALHCLFLCGTLSIYAQYSMPQEMDTASLRSQLDYIEERTRIYNDFRAVREDIFQKMKDNIVDTLIQTKMEIEQLNRTLLEKNQQITGLNSDLETIRDERDNAIRNRDSFSFLGIQMNKTVYNSIMWFLVLGLAVVAVFFSCCSSEPMPSQHIPGKNWKTHWKSLRNTRKAPGRNMKKWW